MLEAQPAERRRTVADAAGALERRGAELARLGAAGMRAQPPLCLHAAVEAGVRTIFAGVAGRHATLFDKPLI
jgi:hypothetical protein